MNNCRFTCPHCETVAQMVWASVSKDLSRGIPELGYIAGGTKNDQGIIRTAICQYCSECSIWYEGVMIYPNRGFAPPPNPDLSDNVRNIYKEASAICDKSPRAAAALLRLAVQHLCIELGGKGENINDDIKKLVKDGLPDKMQKALDIVRIMGNSAVHPGQIDFESSDTSNTVASLFNFINLIGKYCISQEKELNAIYSQLPETARESIEKRDKIP